MKTVVRSSYKKSDGVFIMRKGDGTVKYNGPLSNNQVGTRLTPRPPQTEAAIILRWAKVNIPKVYADYINADSAFWHNLGKKNHSDVQACKKASTIFNQIHVAYLENKVSLEG